MPSDEPSRTTAPFTPVEDQIVVNYHSEGSDAGLRVTVEVINIVLQRLRSLGVTALNTFRAATSDDEASFAVSICRIDNPERTLEDLQSDSELKKFATFERNARIAMDSFDDPLLQQQWALAKLGATEPWTVTPTGGKTIVAIVDSGLRRPDGTVHEDLVGTVEALIDCQPQPTEAVGNFLLYLDGVDRDGHGTLLAGTIAALPDNDKGVASAVPADWNISLLPVKFFENPDWGPNAADAAIAIAHAVDKGAKVINASWHVATGDPYLTNLENALKFATNKRRLVVIAAGNDGTDNEVYPFYPANFSSQFPFKGKMLTVAASDRYDGKAFFSNYGKNTVPLAAPGWRIVTTARYLVDPARYAEYSGTSAAAAYATAGAALVFALNYPNWDGMGAAGWDPADVVQHLIASANTVNGLKLACIGGKRLNLARAVYGPLRMIAPQQDDELTVGIQTHIAWSNTYNNPKFKKVRIDFSKDNGLTYNPLTASTNNDGLYKWTPSVGDGTLAGRIKITPTTGNFPIVSDQFKVV